jgi:hypothetical protein
MKDAEHAELFFVTFMCTLIMKYSDNATILVR